eukprot:4355773-Prymnesium_polylepis.3
MIAQELTPWLLRVCLQAAGVPLSRATRAGTAGLGARTRRSSRSSRRRKRRRRKASDHILLAGLDGGTCDDRGR